MTLAKNVAAAKNEDKKKVGLLVISWFMVVCVPDPNSK